MYNEDREDALVTDASSTVVPIVVSVTCVIALVVVGFVIRKRLQRSNETSLSQQENAVVSATKV
jgi:hypothetical protein